jgi:hypothetical protein
MAKQDALLSGWSQYARVQKLVPPENNPDSAKPDIEKPDSKRTSRP